MRTLVTAIWDVIKVAEKVDRLYPNRPVPEEILPLLYSGNAVRLIMNRRIKSAQKWGITIDTVAKADDGTTHNYQLAFRVNEATSLSQLVPIVFQKYFDSADVDLKDMECVSAIATARALV